MITDDENLVFVKTESLKNAEMTNLDNDEEVVGYNDVLREQTEFEKLRQECRDLVNQHKSGEIDYFEYLDSLQSVFDRLEPIIYRLNSYSAHDEETKQLLISLDEKCESLSQKIQKILVNVYHK